MKNTKTTLKELSHKYRSVLLKCIMFNALVFSFVGYAGAETITGATITDSITDAKYEDSSIDIQKSTDVSIKRSTVLGNDHDFIFTGNGIQGGNISIIDSDLETHGNVRIWGYDDSKTKFSYTCIGDNCKPEEEDGKIEPGDYILGKVVYMDNVDATIGSPRICPKGCIEDYARVDANQKFIIKNSNIELLGNGKLVYEGELEEDGKGLFQINNSTITLNDLSSIEVGEADNTAKAPLEINNSTITLKNSTNLSFVGNNKEGTTLTDTTINLKDTATLTLNSLSLINSDIIGETGTTVTFNGEVYYNGLFDPSASIVNGTLTRDGYDDEITYTLNSAGSLRYTEDKYLYDQTKHNGSTYNLNTIGFNGGALDLRNGTATAIKLASLTLTDGTTSSIYADVDLANETMDRFDETNISGSGKLNIAGLNLISDAIKDVTPVVFTTDSTLIAATNYTGSESGLRALSPMYTYDVSYKDGEFEFTRKGNNPTVYSSSVVNQTVGMLTSNINNIAFAGLAGENNLETGKSAGDVPSVGNAWVKLIGFDDNVDFDSFQTVDSEMFSVLGGMTTDKIKVGSADMNFGFYAGYLDGEAKYTANKINQYGGYLGLSASWMKDNFVLDGTVNAGLIRNEAEQSFGEDKYNTTWASAGLKAGYNFNISNSVVLQPNFYAGYTLVDTEDYTSKSGVKVNNDKAHLFEYAPGLKLSKIFNQTWKGFIQGKYAFLKNNGGKVKANDVALPNISTDNYAEYGIGLSKDFANDWQFSLTANRRDGGRQGWNGSIEFKYNF